MKYSTSILTLFIGLFYLTCGCDCSGTFTLPELSETLIFSEEPVGSPVITSGTVGLPIFLTDPCVLKDQDGYHIFFTTLFCKRAGEYYFSWDAADPLDCDLNDMIGTVSYAFSSDQGLTWVFRANPVVLPGPEAWQSGDLETPFVVQQGDSLYLFYSALGLRDGVEFQSRYQIGAAILDLGGKSIRQDLLDDGAVFTKLPDPILPFNVTTASFDNNTQEPSAIIKDGRIELFYVGIGLSKPDRAVSASGQDITSVGMAGAVFDFDLHLISGSAGYLVNKANITEVQYVDGTYHLFYTTQGSGDFHKGENIGYYRSADGIIWHGPELLLKHGQGSDFDNWGIMAPTVVVEEDSIVMFFSAWGIQDHPCFPVPLTPDTRFGMPFSSDRQCIYGSVGRAVAPRPDDF